MTSESSTTDEDVSGLELAPHKQPEVEAQDISMLWPWMDPDVLSAATELARHRGEQVKSFIQRAYIRGLC